MAKNFEEKSLSAKVASFVEASNAHGEYARITFAEVISFTLRVGRCNLLNDMFYSMTNGGDKAAFVSGLNVLAQNGPEMLLEGQDRNDVLAAMEKPQQRINLFKVGADRKAGIVLNTDNELAKLFRRKLLETFKDDESMVDGLAPIFVKSNKDQNKSAEKAFDVADYLGKVIGTVTKKVDNPELAKALAKEINNVIKVHFGKAKMVPETEIISAVTETATKDEKERQKALEMLASLGYEVKAPAPVKVVDHEPAKPAETVAEKRAANA